MDERVRYDCVKRKENYKKIEIIMGEKEARRERKGRNGGEKWWPQVTIKQTNEGNEKGCVQGEC